MRLGGYRAELVPTNKRRRSEAVASAVRPATKVANSDRLARLLPFIEGPRLGQKRGKGGPSTAPNATETNQIYESKW